MSSFVVSDDPNNDDVILLHGDLLLRIHRARDLPNLDIFTERIRRLFAPCTGGNLPCSTVAEPQSFVDPHRGLEDRNVGPAPRRRHHGPITSDPYVAVRLVGEATVTVARTMVVPNSQEPEWEQRFKIPLGHFAKTFRFEVKDSDVFGAQLIGTAVVSAARVRSGSPFEEWLTIEPPAGRKLKGEPALHVSFEFVPVEENFVYRRGIAGDPECLGVRDTYFHNRKGGSVTLYQDAHVGEGELPDIELDGGRVFRHGRCWEEICEAIMDAQKLIYIAGWSIYHKVRLVRETNSRFRDWSLGQMLKYKSQEGVRVCLLVWDDKTSHDNPFYRTAGVMQTHDEDTKRFFKHSSVICVLSPRYASSKLTMFKQQVVGTLYTHHQKCIIVDTLASNNKRKITAFLGGLDLCDGRYDTSEHRLFSDLDTVFYDDFHNPTLPTKGPRQPWHDLHCKIEGPAAFDVLENFEQRWVTATKFWLGRLFRKKSHWRDDALIMVDRINLLITPSVSDPYGDPGVWVCSEEDSERWHVQVFRSIDTGSVKGRGFVETVHDAEHKNLTCQKNLIVDKSIQTAYIKAIRSAQHFIYIENQYFIGSSFGWPSFPNSGADNLIPMELTLKIVSKIRSREPFSVYIVIPMWPEGDPTSQSVQEILFFQGETMKMMYNIIAQELSRGNHENAHPEHYLNFYCLGKREQPKGDLKSSNLPLDNESLSQKNGRFMIYVHAKGMIVDDEYVLLGSANINQRSLDGSRDTEIAMGAYQPYHSWVSRKRHPRGQVYGYRMSLWAEHLGMIDERFKEPQNVDCVRCVNDTAVENWLRYSHTTIVPLQGHLLKYPIRVDSRGNVTAVAETFPDVGGKILGENTPLPDKLTM